MHPASRGRSILSPVASADSPMRDTRVSKALGGFGLACCAVVLVAGCSSSSGSSSAQPTSPSTTSTSGASSVPRLFVRPAQVAPGGRVHVRATGCIPTPTDEGERGRFLDSAHPQGPALTFAVLASADSATATYRVPQQSAAGQATIEVVCGGDGNAVGMVTVR